jgi:hypothetical protein
MVQKFKEPKASQEIYIYIIFGSNLELNENQIN